MSNVLSEEKRQEILALGRLGWALRRIEAATGVRRETASSYLKAAGVAVREPRRRRAPKPASPGQALTDFSSEKAPGPAAKPVQACLSAKVAERVELRLKGPGIVRIAENASAEALIALLRADSG